MSEHSSHRPESPRDRDEGNSEKDFRNFLGAHQIDDQDPLNPDTAEKNVERRKGIKALAATAFGLDQDATWAHLSHEGGYDAYLQEVETLLEPRETLEFDERCIKKWEEHEGKKCQWVSGLTIFESGSSEEGGVKSVMLSETKKTWSHQPFGGKRNPHEGPVAAILREFGEEAGWENALQLLRAFQRGKVEYMGFYIPKTMSTKSNPLCVQRFALSKDFIDTSAIKSGSDNFKEVWADKDFFASTKVSGTAEAERAWKQIYGFARPKKSGDDVDLSEGDYDGVPDSLRAIINAELAREKFEKQRDD